MSGTQTAFLVQDARGYKVLLAEDCADPGAAEPRAIARAD